jgi:hypothetical protein
MVSGQSFATRSNSVAYKEYAGMINCSAESLQEVHMVIQRREEYLKQAESSCWVEAMKANSSIFNDYLVIITQLGFIFFFSAIFPLAPLIALINNSLLIRINAYKFCRLSKRPIAIKCSGLGVW